MLVFLSVLILLMIVGVTIVSEKGSRMLVLLFSMCVVGHSLLLGAILEERSFQESEKGYNVFPVYKVSGNDTVNTTWYVREKK